MQDTSLIRNFSIIAHIDHGKTTLTDAILRFTKTIPDRIEDDRILDSNPIEKEKGITIKLAPVSFKYNYKNKTYLLNLIDTPGHVDFGYEVSRSLYACEGTILLVDASQGIQAQTLANFRKAKELGLKIIPVINKIDLPNIDIDSIILDLVVSLDIDEKDIILTSAKKSINIDKILNAIIEKIPSPEPKINNPLKALVITSKYDNHLGAITYVRVVEGILKKQKLKLMSSNAEFKPIDIGIFNPDMTSVDVLYTGQVGFIATGLKDTKLLKIGDTITTEKNSAKKPLEGFKEPQPVIFMDIYPIDNDDYNLLVESMDKLALHDSALVFSKTSSLALGKGLKVGFLGIFHAEITRERLEREFNLDIIATTPHIKYKITKKDDSIVFIHQPSMFPDPSLIKQIEEPIAKLTIFTKEEYISNIFNLIQDKRGEVIENENLGISTKLVFNIPFVEIITGLHDALKSITSGFASMEYELIGYKKVDVVKVDILLNHEKIEALSFIALKDKAIEKSRKIVKKLKQVLPRQLFEVPIQAAIGGKIIARETLKAYRKDVTAKLYGGDITRRLKLLRKQAKGKKRLKKFGKVQVNQEAFLSLLKID